MTQLNINRKAVCKTASATQCQLDIPAPYQIKLFPHKYIVKVSHPPQSGLNCENFPLTHLPISGCQPFVKRFHRIEPTEETFDCLRNSFQNSLDI